MTIACASGDRHDGKASTMIWSGARHLNKGVDSEHPKASTTPSQFFCIEQDVVKIGFLGHLSNTQGTLTLVSFY